MDVELYSFEEADGTGSTFTTFDAREARAFAEEYRLRMIANVYEWSDSELVEDFTDSEVAS